MERRTVERAGVGGCIFDDAPENYFYEGPAADIRFSPPVTRLLAYTPMKTLHISIFDGKGWWGIFQISRQRELTGF
jgi:hypothetical protein